MEEFEDILVTVGDYGKYQKILIYGFILPTIVSLPLFTKNTFFFVSAPDHWCNIPELVSTNISLNELKSVVQPPSDSSCTMYDLNYTEILTSENRTVPAGTKTIPCTHGWQYDKTHYDSTAATLWNMVCEDKYYQNFVLTIGFAGSIIGTPVYGTLGDRFGRKLVFYCLTVIAILSSVSLVLVTNFTAFIVLSIFKGSLMPMLFQLPYIIVIELVSPTIRTRMNGIDNIAYAFGLCFLPLIAWLTHGWVKLGLVTSAFIIIYFFYFKLLPESPRWLVSRERYEEALAVMMHIAKVNGKEIDRETLRRQLKKLGEQMKEQNRSGEEASAASLFKYPQLRKIFLIIAFCWVTNVIAYDGTQLNALNFAGNDFINYFVLSIAEVPGYLFSWYFMETWGRRWCAISMQLLTGISCLIPVFTPSGLNNVDVIASFFVKFGASASYMALYQQSAELFPTTMRSLGMGFSCTAGEVAALTVPFIIYLDTFGRFIPFLIIALFCITSGIAAGFLPETLNENLPQTIADAEVFGRKQKFFSLNRKRRPSCHEKIEQIRKQSLEMQPCVK